MGTQAMFPLFRQLSLQRNRTIEVEIDLLDFELDRIANGDFSLSGLVDEVLFSFKTTEAFSLESLNDSRESLFTLSFSLTI